MGQHRFNLYKWSCQFDFWIINPKKRKAWAYAHVVCVLRVDIVYIHPIEPHITRACSTRPRNSQARKLARSVALLWFMLVDLLDLFHFPLRNSDYSAPLFLRKQGAGQETRMLLNIFPRNELPSTSCRLLNIANSVCVSTCCINLFEGESEEEDKKGKISKLTKTTPWPWPWPSPGRDGCPNKNYTQPKDSNIISWHTKRMGIFLGVVVSNVGLRERERETKCGNIISNIDKNWIKNILNLDQGWYRQVTNPLYICNLGRKWEGLHG